MRSYIRPVSGNERRDRENSSGRRIMSRKNVSFDRHEIDVSSYRSNSNYSKTSPRASERSILILRLNYWYLTRISIALLGNRVIKTRRTVIYRSFSKLILFHLTWNKWKNYFDKFKKKNHLSNSIWYRFNFDRSRRVWIIRAIENEVQRRIIQYLENIWYLKFWIVEYYRSF